MQNFDKLYNRARLVFIQRISLVTILPYTIVSFLFTYLTSANNSSSASILFYSFVSSVVMGVLVSVITMSTVFSKKKVYNYCNILQDKFPNSDFSLLLLLSFYLIQNYKVYSLEKPDYFNRQLKVFSKSYGILYTKEDDEDEVKEILEFAKHTNFKL